PTYKGMIRTSDAANHPRKPISMNMTKEYCAGTWTDFDAFREFLNNARDDGSRVIEEHREQLAVPVLFIETINKPCKTSVVIHSKTVEVIVQEQWRGFVLIKGTDKGPRRMLLWRVAKQECDAEKCKDLRNSESPDTHWYVSNYGSRLDGEQHFRFDRSYKKRPNSDYSSCEHWMFPVIGEKGDGLKVSIGTCLNLDISISLASNECLWRFVDHDFGPGQGTCIGKCTTTNVETNDATQVEMRTERHAFNPF